MTILLQTVRGYVSFGAAGGCAHEAKSTDLFAAGDINAFFGVVPARLRLMQARLILFVPQLHTFREKGPPVPFSPA